MRPNVPSLLAVTFFAVSCSDPTPPPGPIPPTAVPTEEAPTALPAEEVRTNYDPDVDLANAPAYYRKRVLQFRNLLRKEPTRSAKIRKAIAIANDPGSKFVRDAVEFLGDVRAKEAVPALIRLCRKPNQREFALHSLGEIRDARAIPVFIRYLSDPSENVRGNAFRALEKTSNRSFGYRYYDPPAVRARAVTRIEAWWKESSATFEVRETTQAESDEAEEAWKRFGRQYLDDLNRR